MIENVAEFSKEQEKMLKKHKPQIFCVTPIRKELFMLAEDAESSNNNDELEGQECYPDCNPCGPCSPCSPQQWDRDDCYPDCNPCSPCNPCQPQQWDKDDCYPDCNPCSPCSPCRPEQR